MQNIGTKQTRVRCSDKEFLEAVYSSNTYAEISEKTGQKIASTMARYSRVKSALEDKGLVLPAMKRSKPKKKIDNIEIMADIVRKLDKHYES